MIPAVKLATSLLGVAFLAAARGGNGPAARTPPSARPGASPSTSPVAEASATPTDTPASSPPPAPLTGAFAVLATPTSAGTYTVSIAATNAKIVGSATPTTPTARTCGHTSAAVAPIP